MNFMLYQVFLSAYVENYLSLNKLYFDDKGTALSSVIITIASEQTIVAVVRNPI